MKKLSNLIVLAIAFMVVSFSAFADYPSKSAKIVVPFAPGGAVDVTGRIIAEVAQEYYGKKIIVENKPGGGGVVGQTFASKSRPDGYTVLAYTSSVINNPITKKTTYTYKDFRALGMYCFDPEVIIVHKDSEIKSMKEFLAKAEKESLTIALPGFSTSHHVAALVLEQRHDKELNLKYTQNQSAAMQMQQLLGGHVDGAFVSMGEALQYYRSGDVRVLGVANPERVSEMPDVPTFIESGVNIKEYGTFRGLAVPSGVDEERFEYLESVFEKTINSDEFKERMSKAGYPVVYYNAEEFSAYLDNVAELMETILPTLK